ncbi:MULTISPECIES: 3-deoxy-D-manno-octulosonic acid transferase [Comamonas]|uniref:3-deoxy-D-manno-octulosonic acid transferase n=1 Tax=Comamonas TaxID=283 RepID=UPI0005557347|nr:MULTISPECIES: 3-deoxy-D-manno-octulosonic acid transferase [Comamonas]TZG07852.1 3-deoxy-D-manno-octulosonic acid transferase [Comamonas thiooxydans]UNV88781.1 3-deoxy-D-manno-octulosonic acid transferase [Comamonas sp. 7D-2evo1]UNV97919.1 3-deoxy-D-manno-octulosonic acid transferase [Comamonas sp. 7D-2]UNV98423.1 3-deoxy-D-manno-octulosonic acid transferase [Comamonas sp. 7D-2evo2]
MARPAPMSFARALFSALAWAMQPLLRRKLRRRALAEPGYGVAVPERFGHYQPADLGRDGRGRWVWIHSVSLGETRAAAILIKALRERMPAMRLLLTHSTATGREEGAKLLHPGDVQVWLPWDSLGATRRFVAQFQPAVGVLMETEIWPNLIAACTNTGIPLALANARLNEKSEAGALRVRPLSRPAYAALAAVWAQTETDAKRLRNVGASVDAVLGNLKFDVQPDTAQIARAGQWRAELARPVLLFASSREGEEAMFIDALKALGDAAAAVQWLVVPRHPQRFDEVASLLGKAGFAVSRRSQWGQRPPVQSGAIWLGDSLGEMPLYYGLAAAALMGGSFAPLGGQNLIEALACDCPVILGPHTFNFSQASEQALLAGAAIGVQDMYAGLSEALDLAASADRLQAAVQSCRQMVQGNRGAAAATAEAIQALMNAP